MLKSKLTTEVVEEKKDWNDPKLVQCGTTMLLTTGGNTEKSFSGVVIFCSNNAYSLGYCSSSFDKHLWKDVNQDVSIQFTTTKK